MGQKVNPIGFRLGINRTWDSRWYADRDYAKLLHQDLKLRDYLMNRLSQAGVGRTWEAAFAITARQPRLTPSRPANGISTALAPEKPITSQGMSRPVPVSIAIRAPTDIA